jgi:hypothetical protein
VHVARARPPLDACEQALDPRPVAPHAIVTLRLLDDCAGVVEHGHQVLGSRQDEDIGVLAVAIARKSLVGLARDRWQAKRPPEAEWTVASTGVVRQRELRTEAATARRREDRHVERAGPGHRVGGELLADPTDRTTTLGQFDRWRRN